MIACRIAAQNKAQCEVFAVVYRSMEQHEHISLRKAFVVYMNMQPHEFSCTCAVYFKTVFAFLMRVMTRWSFRVTHKGLARRAPRGGHGSVPGMVGRHVSQSAWGWEFRLPQTQDRYCTGSVAAWRMLRHGGCAECKPNKSGCQWTRSEQVDADHRGATGAGCIVSLVARVRSASRAWHASTGIGHDALQ